jgi:hypothetical protein
MHKEGVIKFEGWADLYILNFDGCHSYILT